MTAASHWQRNPKSQNYEDTEAIKAPHFAYSLYKKAEHELNVAENCSHHQTNHDKIILFQLNKSSPQSTPALPGIHPPRKASVSSITDYSHRGSGNYTQSYRTLCFCQNKNISWCLTAGKDNSSNWIFELKPLHFQKCLYPITKRVILASLTLHKLLPLS